MSKLSRILNGWKNLIIENTEVESLAAKRAVHCASCDSAKEGVFEILEEKRIKEVKGMGCVKCSCPLSAKIRSVNEKCPLDKW